MSTLCLPLGGRALTYSSGACAGLLLTLLAGRAMGQGFAGQWETTLGTGPTRTVYASTMFDFDGTGAVPVIGTGDGSVRVLAKRGGGWVPVGPAFSGFEIHAFAQFDVDGDGPLPVQLIAAGHFAGAGTTNVNRVARWDGTAWQPLGTGVNDAVYTMTVFDPDGSGPAAPQLIVGGRFTQRGSSGGPALNGVARWDGTAWQPLGSGVSGFPNAEVHALASFDADGDGPMLPKLIVGGTFTTAGGAAASNIAAWDGSSWSALGSGVSGAPVGAFVGLVSALYEDRGDEAAPQSPRLVAGGYFTTAGGQPSVGVAQWDGASWQSLGTSNRFSVHALTRFDPDGAGPLSSRLVAAKDAFAQTPDLAVCVVGWDGTAWQPIGAGVGPYQQGLTLTVDSNSGDTQQSTLIAGGNFQTVGGAWMPLLARWDGEAWSAMVSGRSGEPVRDAVVFDADGAGPEPSRLVTLGSNILAWDGSDWSPFNNEHQYNFAAEALALYDETGSAGSPSTLLMSGTVYFDDDTTQGRSFELAPSGWEMFGLDFGFTESMMFDPDGAGPLPAELVAASTRGVARWDGEQWQALGGQTNSTGTITSLASFDPDGPGPLPPRIVVAGSLTSIGGVTLNRVAQWDGAAWQPLGSGLGGLVNALAVFDPDGNGPQAPRLIAGGGFTTLGGTGGASASRLAQWDGVSWSQFAGGAGSTVNALLVEDPDGQGPRPEELYVAGGFASLGGVSMPSVGRWDGAHWHRVGDGVGPVNELLLYRLPSETRPRLVAFGPQTAGRWAVPGIAMLSAWPSPADTGSAGGVAGPDGALNNNDFIAFINLFFANDANADVGRAGGLPGADGLFDNNDFIAFISFFFAG